jgi:hypothetical protein
MSVCQGDLEAQDIEPLPARAALASLLGGSLFDSANLASLIGDMGAAGGNADQTAPIVQGLTTTPALPTI